MIAEINRKIDSEQPHASSAELKTRLCAFARETGFDSCRVAKCVPPPHADEFGKWLRQGAAGEMNYMERGEEKRRDPQKVLPGARSIVVLAFNYFKGKKISADTVAPIWPPGRTMC